MKHFCQKCGNPTIYALALPKFCSQCGSEFSLVTKPQDQSHYDQALEKAKQKYPRHSVETIPVTKAEPKNYPNPARASIKYRLVDDDNEESTYSDEEDLYLEDVDREVSPQLFAKIKPKFTVQNYRNNSESFESLLTEGYLNNYKPTNLSETRGLMGPVQPRPAESILEEFKREASSNRRDSGSQD